jgi:two-component system nitrogen regulation sensor histidine kinase NtrY
VVGVDGEGAITAANSRALALLDLDHDGAIGRPLADAAPELAAVWSGAAQSGRDAEDEVDIARHGETRRLRIRASGSAEGGMVITFDDITRLVAAQRNAAWRDVARRIAHEIKNPLTPIQLSAERIRRKYRAEITSDLETFDRCTDTIVRQVEDIGKMVDEFSSYDRVGAPSGLRPAGGQPRHRRVDAGAGAQCDPKMRRPHGGASLDQCAQERR